MMWRARPAALFLLALSLTACGGDAGPTTPTPDREVASVVLTPQVDTLTALDATVQLTARALNAAGDEVGSVSFTWSSSDDGVITVDDRGVATATGNGAARVRAAVAGVTGTAELAVRQRVAAVTVTPASVVLTTAGATQQFVASATDANGNPVTDGEFVWDSEDPTVATVDRNGLATAKGSGASTVTATAQDIPGHADLTVNQAAAGFAFITAPSDAVAGESIDPAIRVEVRDSAGNRVEDAEIDITLALAGNPGGSSLHGTRTVTSTAGVSTFSGLWLDRAAVGYTLSASAPGTVAADTSAPFAITAAAATDLAFVTGPADLVAGEPMSPAVEVEVRDAFGNVVTTGPDSVAMTIGVNVGGGTLFGTRRVQTVNGRATFGDLTIDRSGRDYRLSVQADSMEPRLSGVFDVSPAAPAHLRFDTEPGSVRGQEPFDPAVAVVVEDTFGNPSDDSVTLILEPNPSNGRVVGQATRAPVEGAVTFAGVGPDNPGTGYVIRAVSGSADTMSAAFDVTTEFTQLSAGYDMTCGVTALNKVYCWGRDDFDQLGSGGRTDPDCTVASTAYRCARSPMALAGGLDVESVGAGLISACALTTAGAAYCWGDNAVGALGDGTTTASTAPVAVAGGLTFTQLAVGWDFACGLTAGGQAYCWGTDQVGQLGDGAGSAETCNTGTGSTQCSTVPRAVAGGLTFVDLAAGEAFACGVTAGGETYCWGQDEYGQLGDGSSSSGTCTTALGSTVGCSESPTLVVTGESFAAVAAGGSHVCSLTTAGKAFCWGLNNGGQLNGDPAVTETCGTGGLACATSPVAVNDTVINVGSGAETVDSIQFTGIAPGGGHTCAVGTAMAGGAAVYSGPLCWGDNGVGQTGIGYDGGMVDDPTAPSGGVNLTTVVGGGHDACGLTAAGTAFCWGANAYGQIGDGTTALRPAPTRIVQ